MIALFYYNKQYFDEFYSNPYIEGIIIQEIMIREIDGVLVSFFTITSDDNYQTIYKKILRRLDYLESICLSYDLEQQNMEYNPFKLEISKEEKTLYSMSMEEFNNDENRSIISPHIINISGIESYRGKIRVYFYAKINNLLCFINPYNALSISCYNKGIYHKYLYYIMSDSKLYNFYKSRKIHFADVSVTDAMSLRSDIRDYVNEVQETEYNDVIIFKIYGKLPGIGRIIYMHSNIYYF